MPLLRQHFLLLLLQLPQLAVWQAMLAALQRISVFENKCINKEIPIKWWLSPPPTYPGLVDTLWLRLSWQPIVLCAIETSLRIITIEGIAAQAQISVAVMTLKAIAMQHETLHGSLLHQINGLLAEAALLGGGLLLEGQCHLRALCGKGLREYIRERSNGHYH